MFLLPSAISFIYENRKNWELESHMRHAEDCPPADRGIDDTADLIAVNYYSSPA